MTESGLGKIVADFQTRLRSNDPGMGVARPDSRTGPKIQGPDENDLLGRLRTVYGICALHRYEGRNRRINRFWVLQIVADGHLFF